MCHILTTGKNSFAHFCPTETKLGELMLYPQRLCPDLVKGFGTDPVSKSVLFLSPPCRDDASGHTYEVNFIDLDAESGPLMSDAWGS